MSYLTEFLKEYRNRVYLLVLILMALLFFYVSSIIVPLIIGALLAYLTYPFYKRLNKRVKSKNIASVLITILTFLLIIIPSIYLVIEFTNEMFNFYTSLNQEDQIFSMKEELIKTIYYLVPYENVRDKLIEFLIQTENYLIKAFYNFLVNLITLIPTLLFKIIVIIIVEFYFLIYGKDAIRFIEKHLPFGPYNHKIIHNLKKTIDSLIFGIIIPAAAQALALIVILIILGVKLNYLFYGFISFILALFPTIGIWIVWIPIAVKLWFISKVKAITLAIYGLFFISNIDNLVRILVTSKIGNLPLWLVLLTVFGGLLTKGFVGMIISLALGSFIYYTYLDILNNNKN